jgi:hypothetical protein
VDDGLIDVIEQGMGLRVEALDASAIVAGADCRFDLTLTGTGPYWCFANCSIQ